MAKFTYDPESLANALDVMVAGGNVPRDDVLLQTAARVYQAPEITIDPAAADQIEVQVLDAFNNLPPAPTLPYQALLGGFIVVVLIVAGIWFGMSESQPAVVATPPPSATLTMTATTTPIATASVTLSATATLTVTTEAMQTPSASVTVPTAMPTQTIQPSSGTLPLDVNLIIEGPIEAINDNIIVIYGIEVIVNLDDPMLGVIEIGDTIRVEGSISEDSSGVSIEALEITSDDIAISDEGEVWSDNGSCDNPPPPWAPANGWRRRCEGQAPNAGNGNGNGGGGDDDDKGRGNDDDDG